jgi:hypothetical protein
MGIASYESQWWTWYIDLDLKVAKFWPMPVSGYQTCAHPQVYTCVKIVFIVYSLQHWVGAAMCLHAQQVA